MGWATSPIQRLLSGETVQFRPKGNSMQPKIESGQLCTVQPIGDLDISVGDIVLCKVHGREFLHLVKAHRPDGTYQIGNNKGHINGWVRRTGIYGKLIRIDP